jgi:hypothetical protein
MSFSGGGNFKAFLTVFSQVYCENCEQKAQQKDVKNLQFG